MSEKTYGRVHVEIRGLTPILMNRMNPEALKDERIGPGKKKYVPEEEARKAAYIAVVDGKEQLYIPARWLYSMIVKAAAEYKAEGKRSSIASLLAGTIRVEPENIMLGHCNYEIDERPVVIQRARVLAWRPMIKDWTVEFDIVYNKTYFSNLALRQLEAVLKDGAVRLGIGDFRPQHKGWFGTFEVTKFEVES